MKFDVNKRGIKVLENYCFMCGTMKHITNHHTIPRYLKPNHNVEIPVCSSCHNKIHSSDTNCLAAFAYKIFKTFKTCTKNLIDLQNKLEEFKKIKKSE